MIEFRDEKWDINQDIIREKEEITIQSYLKKVKAAQALVNKSQPFKYALTSSNTNVTQKMEIFYMYLVNNKRPKTKTTPLVKKKLDVDIN
ncbi:hypothetical protein PIROE2DRAFT_10498 [Piromyces sp. E2]|nr:hypothetical protein PIROE2DRAFT_10498 [Piromyces sp. E2]|eukprot:OUM63082.1 hypothetical protein PIROE2DRAFT_10498 [Piromyces sp. E2]